MFPNFVNKPHFWIKPMAYNNSMYDICFYSKDLYVVETANPNELHDVLPTKVQGWTQNPTGYPGRVWGLRLLYASFGIFYN